MGLLAWAILLLALGLFILILEFFIPSSGVLGVMATLCIFGAVWLGFSYSFTAGLAILATAALAVPSILLAAIHYWPMTPLGKRILIKPPNDEETLPATDAYRKYPQLIGKRGRAKTEMLPGGTVEIENRRYDAVSDCGAIPAGTPILVIRLETQRLVVRVDESPAPKTQPLAIEPAQPTTSLPRSSEQAQPVDQTDNVTRPSSPFEEPLI